MLNDGGLYLNHGIHHEFHWRRTTQTDFLYRNVFPNGDLSGLTETLTEMERARWEVLDVENLRLHYARTCRHWAERLQARAEDARTIVGERIYRTWLLYLTCSSVAFAGRLHRALPGPHAQAVGPELHPADNARRSLRLRRTPIRAHLLSWRGRGKPSTYSKYASGCRALAASHLDPSRRPVAREMAG